MPAPAARLLLLFLWLSLTGWGPCARAQTPATDSLRRILAHTPADSTRVLLLLELGRTYRASRPDSTMYLAQEAWQLARRLNFEKGRGRAQGMIGMVLRERGDLPKAYANQLIAIQLSRQTHDPEGEAYSLNCLGNISLDLRQYPQAIGYYRASEGLYRRLHRLPWVAGALTNLGSCYEKLNQLDSALALQQRAEALIAQNRRPRLAVALALRNMGVVQARLGHYPEAFAYYRRALHETQATNDLRNRAMAHYHMALLFEQLHQPDSSLLHARDALLQAQAVSYRLTVMDAGTLLARLYQARHRPDSAFHYQSLAGVARDSLFGPEKFRQLELLAFTEQQQQLRQRAAQEQQTANYQRAGLLALLGVLLTVALLLGWANRRQRRANRLLNERNAQIEAQRNALDEALTEVQAIQAQLVAAEKWAFVGELSAGIANELQNPLAFMRKFADVSVGLLDHDGTTPPDGLEQQILDGLKQNLHEISAHGQRASAIIADMLAHARPGPRLPVPTDLNALVAENLRLAYQSAPDQHLAPAVELETHFDAAVGTVATVPQELGRALLNLFTNAFYAVRQHQQASGPGFQPQVCVRTRRASEWIEVEVHDNGFGIPASMVERVFQPFFTTKPASDGTGLGLSLAYDIITKGHAGTLTVETQEGKFTRFTVRLPA
ncbi:tetratricopeptide repeat protein [Microvirga sp. STS02]|uniref:tetratricopeptide repeat-containing sensor histidine kinase n=1 Tax=Hymenobacter negativus TaxID=2795026 RepID=UPI0018DD4ACF|nr:MULTISPECIES: tetratricopeptide repeat protein [Bacteria]MBH8571410.1 tetratricopeptide repeat protein [Hymenobacter negativus]MBR7211150.1 tetratricopeptide repeat protein [Microvirga sp. STS02]